MLYDSKQIPDAHNIIIAKKENPNISKAVIILIDVLCVSGGASPALNQSMTAFIMRNGNNKIDFIENCEFS